jgi:hypothetical protein
MSTKVVVDQAELDVIRGCYREALIAHREMRAALKVAQAMLRQIHALALRGKNRRVVVDLSQTAIRMLDKECQPLHVRKLSK